MGSFSRPPLPGAAGGNARSWAVFLIYHANLAFDFRAEGGGIGARLGFTNSLRFRPAGARVQSGGFSLVTFTVATRVVLGHSGNEHLFRSPLPSLRTVTLFIVASVILRAVADFFVESRAGLMNWASSLWMLAALVWAIFILPKVRTPDSTEEGTCKGRSKRLKPAVN